MVKKIVLGVVAAAALSFAGEAKITAAADLVYCFKEMEAAFEKKNPGEKLTIAYGSSGKAYTQISNGAPYDMYFSANMEYVQKLKDAGLAVTNPKPYAYGRIGIWTKKTSGIDVSKGLPILLDPKVKKISLPDPAHAPYGVAAVNALKSQNYLEKVKSKFALGENATQSAQFAQSGAAEVALLPISLGYSDVLKKEGNYYLLPGSWHNDIVQGYAILKGGKDNPTAKKFEEFVSSKEAREIFKKYGFVLPNE